MPSLLPEGTLEALAHHENDPIHNTHFVVINSDSAKTHLQAAVAMLMARLNKVTHTRVEGCKLFFSRGISIKESDYVKLPFALDVVGAVQLAENFLRQLDPKQLPRAPDHDGSNGRGWKVANEGYWGDFSVSFHWMEYHK